jgi:pyruvate/2-oxoglutarate dehydrogenase complex dihydrolipoamide dehydrogenase (E3) component
LLIATGRRPRTADLDLDKAGVTSRPDGSIMVNDKLETSVPGIWALGDVKGGPAFTHISYNDFQIVYSNLVEGADLSIKNRIVPYAVYTDPEVGAVGITETEARKQGKQLKVGCIPLSSVARAVENGETEGLMKVVIDAGTDQILGARIVCSGGGEIIHALYMLMLAKAPYTLLKQAVYVHPTLTEGLFRLIESVKPVA